MSRFVLATLGSLGDLHPFLAVGRALQDRGHTAVIATSPEYEPLVHAAGLQFATLRPSFAAMGDSTALARRLFTLRGPHYLVAGLVMPAIRESYADCLRAAQHAALLVSHPLTFPIRLVAEQRHLPWMSVVLAPASLMSRADPPLFPGLGWVRRLFGLNAYLALLRAAGRATRRWTRPLTALRQEIGLPPTDLAALFEGQYSPFGTLALFDAVLAERQPDWPVETLLCGPALYDSTPPDTPLPEGLDEFLAGGEPPIVFALGSSAVWIADDYWTCAVAAVERLGRRAILLTGSILPAQFPAALPATVRAYPYLPYSAIFRRAAVVVHQAGIGTLSQALRSGAPQLITPVAFDQPDNARRAVRLGVARVLPFRRVTARALHAQIEALLADPRYAQAARAMAHRLRPLDGAALAAERLIACAVQARPA